MTLFDIGQRLATLQLSNTALRLNNALLRNTLSSYRSGAKAPEAAKALAEIVDKARAALNAGHVGGRPETLLEACERVCSEREQARRDAEEAEQGEDKAKLELAHVRDTANNHASSLNHELEQRLGTIDTLKRQIGDLLRRERDAAARAAKCVAHSECGRG